MINNPIWTYLDKLVTRRQSVEFRKMIGTENYAVCVNGIFMGIGPSCKAALNDAIMDAKRKRD